MLAVANTLDGPFELQIRECPKDRSLWLHCDSMTPDLVTWSHQLSLLPLLRMLTAVKTDQAEQVEKLQVCAPAEMGDEKLLLFLFPHQKHLTRINLFMYISETPALSRFVHAPAPSSLSFFLTAKFQDTS